MIRQADPDLDGAACASIYAPYVTDSVASFEAEPPSAEEMSRRIRDAHCWLVADEAGVVGYAYGSRHRERAAYRWAADVAIYLDPAQRRQGLGRALYVELIARLRDAGFWTLCAGIALPNAASEGLHQAMGFEPVGTYRRIGWKAGAWHDVRWWQLDLRPGDGSQPLERHAPDHTV
jgi:phosphinothricin acetyltransferase